MRGRKVWILELVGGGSWGPWKEREGQARDRREVRLSVGAGGVRPLFILQAHRGTHLSVGTSRGQSYVGLSKTQARSLSRLRPPCPGCQMYKNQELWLLLSRGTAPPNPSPAAQGDGGSLLHKQSIYLLHGPLFWLPKPMDFPRFLQKALTDLKLLPALTHRHAFVLGREVT